MKTKCVATIISLSPGIHSVIASAVSLLNSVSQDAFAFKLGGGMRLPHHPTPETPRLWSELGAVLFEERKRRQYELMIAVLDDPIQNNWFSHAAYGKNVAWITTHDWEFYSDLPAVSFVAYDIVLNVVLLQLVTRPEDESWLMEEVIHTKESRECISDLCAYKPDVSQKIRSGRICLDCRGILGSRMGREALSAVEALLKAISSNAHPTKPQISIGDFPGLRQMLKETKGVLLKAQQRVDSEQSRVTSLECEKGKLELRLKEVKQQLENEVRHVYKSEARLELLNRTALDVEGMPTTVEETAPFSIDRPGLAEQVERRYPFPIAYCFRSMRAELNPTDRWNALFELYGLIIRYVVFVFLSGLRHQQTGCPEELKALIQKLKFGYAGDWGKVCIALLKHWQKNDKVSFFNIFLVTLSAEKLGKFEAASRSIVKTRNAMEHGFKGDKQGCQTFFDRHLPEVKNMLQFIEPLADYVLIRPVQIVDNVDGQCIYFSKIMAGSDPQFLPKQMISSSVPETVCQLLSQGGTLTLHPWVHLNRCDSCLREMAFVYNAIHMQDGKEVVLLSEYPSNHKQWQPSLVPLVKRLLSV